MPESDDIRGDEADGDELPAGARPFWSGTISFGLVSIPVQLLSAQRPRGVTMRTLAPDGTPLRREYYCPEDGETLAPDEVVRGFELDDGRYVVVTDEELEGLLPERSRDIDLRRFVPREEVDPAFFERAYYLAPGEGSLKAYRLLAETLERSGRVGIATFVLRGKEHLVAIHAKDGVLRGETLRFADELRPPEEAGLPLEGEPDPEALQAMEEALQALARETLPVDLLVDEAGDALRRKAEAKLKRHRDVVELDEGEAPTEGAANPDADDAPVDIVEVLRRSLREGAASKKKKPAARGRKTKTKMETKTKK